MTGVEATIISHVITNGDEPLAYLVEQGITPQYFTEQRSAAAYGWILEWWAKHGHVPDQGTFERRYSNFTIIYSSDPIEALADELRDHYAKAVAAEYLPQIATEWAKPVGTFSLDKVLGLSTEMHESVSIVRAVNETALLTDRVTGYLKELDAMDGTKMPGIPTGFQTLDLASGGWQAENFGIIGAAPKRFKTAILVWMALAAARHGKRAAVLTFEMSIKELMDRIFCLGAKVSYTHIMRGALSAGERSRIDDFADEMKEWEGDIEIIHDIAAATTLAGFTAQIRTKTHRPDILFIDGVYQMTDTSREWSNETAALTAVSRGIKRFAATEKIPVVATTQALDSRITKGRGTQMSSIGYTSAFAQDANVVLTIDRDNMQSNDVVLKVAGARSMSGIMVSVTVDLNNGNIYEGGEITDGGGDSQYG